MDAGRCGAQYPKLGTVVVQPRSFPSRAEATLHPCAYTGLVRLEGRRRNGRWTQQDHHLHTEASIPLCAEGIPAGSQRGAAGSAATPC